MILFNNRPTLEEAWEKTSFRVLMGGFGDDFAMLLAELFHRGYEPDEIVFCDTGSEFPHTYQFIEYVKAWCAANNWSKVVHLRKLDKFKQPLKLIEVVEKEKTLPAAAFGKKSCSLRYKVETADKYFNNHPKAHEAWGVTRKGTKIDTHTGSILRMVGLNADEPGRVARWSPEHKWCQVFPLFDWDIGERESKVVEAVGLYYPGKSSCFMCPHLTGGELFMLMTEYPELFLRVWNLEQNYIENQRTPESTTKGLCRSHTIAEKLEKWVEKGGDYDPNSESKCNTCHG